MEQCVRIGHEKRNFSHFQKKTRLPSKITELFLNHYKINIYCTLVYFFVESFAEFSQNARPASGEYATVFSPFLFPRSHFSAVNRSFFSFLFCQTPFVSLTTLGGGGGGGILLRRPYNQVDKHSGPPKESLIDGKMKGIRRMFRISPEQFSFVSMWERLAFLEIRILSK